MTSFAEKLAMQAMQDDDSDDADDKDYVPQEKEEKEYEKELLNNMTEKERKKYQKKLKNAHKVEKRAQKAWKQILEDVEKQQNIDLEKRKKIQTEQNNQNGIIYQESLQIAQKVIEDQQKTDTKKVRFAGKDFIVDDKGNIMQEEEKIETKDDKQEEQGDKDELFKIREGFRYVNVLMDKIKQKTKQLNSLSKSKYDWKNYAKKEKIESQLEQNRKGGYLQKQNFLQESKLKQKEYRKAKK